MNSSTSPQFGKLEQLARATLAALREGRRVTYTTLHDHEANAATFRARLTLLGATKVELDLLIIKRAQ